MIQTKNCHAQFANIRGWILSVAEGSGRFEGLRFAGGRTVRCLGLILTGVVVLATLESSAYAATRSASACEIRADAIKSAAEREIAAIPESPTRRAQVNAVWCRTYPKIIAAYRGPACASDKRNELYAQNSEGTLALYRCDGNSSRSDTTTPSPNSKSPTASDGRADFNNPESMKCFDMQMKSAKQFSDELATVKGDTRAENAVRTRRYKAQKALFEGQCAGTPQAARQLALANEKLKELGASASQGSAGNNQGGSAGNSQGGSASSKDEAAAKVQIDRARNAADANARRQAERAAAQSSSGMERTAKQQESDAWLAQQSLTRGTECVTPIKQGLYGAFKNTCDYKVWVEFCAFRPNPKAWSSWTDCEKPKGFSGVVEVKARSIESAHVLGAETIYWVACVYPYTTTQSVFERGRGIKAVCHK